MKSDTLGRLTAALESAGFEVVSVTEETRRHVARKQGAWFRSGESLPDDNEPTGTVVVELKTT